MKRNALLILLITTLLIAIGFFSRQKMTGYNKSNEAVSVKEQVITEIDSKEHNNGTSEIASSSEISASARNTFQLLNGTLRFDLVFHDSSLNDTDKFRISKDLNHLYADVIISLGEIDGKKYLLFEGLARLTPEALQIPLIVREVNEQILLDIPKSVCEAYKTAFEFIEESNIDESEVNTLLSHAETGSLTLNSIIPLSAPSVSTDDLNKAIISLSQRKFKVPSPLTYRLQTVNGVQVLSAETLSFEYDNQKVSYIEPIWLVLIDNQWKIAL